MKFVEKLKKARAALEKNGLDGWLLYDFAGSNSLAREFLEIDPGAHITRRFFYWIPHKGDPVKVVHRLEPGMLDHLPGEKKVLYSRYTELESQLQELLEHAKKIAMEYSPCCEIPAVSKVDGGTIELIRKSAHGIHIFSSGPFLQEFTCILSKEQLQLHFEAAAFLEDLVEQAWQFIETSISHHTQRVTEYDVQEFIFNKMTEGGYVTDGRPICAVGPNAADPHYEPTRERCSQIEKGHLVMIDLWAKKNVPGAVYGDMTRMGFAGNRDHLPEKMRLVFETVKNAQESALQFVMDKFEKGDEVRGCDVDEVAREVIETAGFGEYFIHRTGHNLYTTTHGPGAHLDSFETRDTRPLIPETAFTIEPGIYIPGEFGVRLEYDLYISAHGAISVQCGKQSDLRFLL